MGTWLAALDPVLAWAPGWEPQMWPAQEALQQIQLAQLVLPGLLSPGCVVLFSRLYRQQSPREGEGRGEMQESCCSLTYPYTGHPPQCVSRHLCCSCPTRHPHSLVFQNSLPELPLYI